MKVSEKMNTPAIDEDADVFEITDFTTASEWERFVARFEEILHEWKLANRPPHPPAVKDEYTNGTWEERTDEIIFADFRFKIAHRYLKTAATTESRNSEEKERRDENEDVVDDEQEKTPTVFSDLMNLENDFPSRAHCLCRWYGLQEFIIISPAVDTEIINSETRTRLLLSSASIAMNNTACTVPVFIQVQQKWRKLYSGICIVPGASVEFEMAHLKRFPLQYNHLAGLLDVFKSKLGCVYISMPPVSVSVRFTYVLNDWVNTFWPQAPPDFSSVMDGEVGCTGFGALPFGACEDPVCDLNLACTWPSLSEDMIVENHVYSDLDPLQAPQWSVRVSMTEDLRCLLSDYIREFRLLFSRKETTDELLGNLNVKETEKDQSADISHALQRLTEPTVSYNIPTLGNVVSQATTRLKIKPEEAPISTDMLNQILLFLFPDAKGGHNEVNEMKDNDENSVGVEKSVRYNQVLNELKKQMKSAPLDSLTHKLAVCLCLVNHNNGSLRAVAHLWQEFVLEMRYRWENNHFISGVEQCQPNMAACILHQKLQMLNCCIERKIKRQSMGYGYGEESEETSSRDLEALDNYEAEALTPPVSFCDDENAGEATAGGKPSLKRISSACSSSEDEFYECDDESKENIKGTETRKEDSGEKSDDPRCFEESLDSGSVTSETSFKDTVSYKPEGRLAPYKDMKLLNTGEQMFIPITQEPSPMTEDMLEEHAEVLAKMGSSQEGTQLRARMQSACLLSDMESFKAANPGCTLEDFVRWYSPRDWVEKEVEEDGDKEVRFCLSQRMQIPGNMWAEVWHSARSVPARRQKRLFDDTKEAEKVLHFLISLKPAEVIYNMMPMLIHAAIAKLLDHEEPDVPTLKTLVDQIVSKSIRVTRNPNKDFRKIDQLIRMIELAETVIARTKSLKSKFTADLLDQQGAEEELHHFVSSLLQQPEVVVRGGPCGPAGSIIHKLFVASQKASYMVIDEDDEDEQAKEDLHKPVSTVPDFPCPTAREYILRAMVPRPAPYSRVMPQKMYCVLVENDYKLMGAFSSDTTFQ